MQYFKVRNWESLQHYKDRAPPWIKLYNHLLDDYEFACLQDASKLHLVLIWLLASRNDNRLPYNARWIKQRIGVDSDVDLDELAGAGFLEVERSNDGAHQLAEQHASNMLAECKHIATTEERREEQRRAEGEGEGEENISSPSAPDSVRAIFDYWQSVMGKANGTRLTSGRRDKIKARLKEGYTEDQIKQAITGCSKSEFHMGKNDQGIRYNDIDLICRNGQKVEQFIGYLTSAKTIRDQEAEDWANGGVETYTTGETIDHEPI